MVVGELVARLVGFGRANSIESLVAAAPYLEALARALGERDAREVTAKELHAFHRGAPTELTEPVLRQLVRKAQRWEGIYLARERGMVQVLPWESDRPVKALVELFDRPGFRPRTALELGCGDGVNAVFMASRGCRVTAVDVSATALELARERQRAAGVEVELVEGDCLALPLGPEPYDFVFDRGMFHHLQVFDFEDYKRVVADRLVADGYFHLICHDVSTRPTLVLDALCGGAMGKLLGFLSGPLVETGCGFTGEELREIFSDRFRFESIEVIEDDNKRPFRFQSAVMRNGAAA